MNVTPVTKRTKVTRTASSSTSTTKTKIKIKTPSSSVERKALHRSPSANKNTINTKAGDRYFENDENKDTSLTREGKSKL